MQNMKFADLPPRDELNEMDTFFANGKILNHGGSSIVYELANNKVAKEKLSKYASEIIGNKHITPKLLEEVKATEIRIGENERRELISELKEKQEKLLNNIKICDQYLGDFVLKSETNIRKNKNGMPSLYIIQEKIPSDVKFLAPENWDFKMDDEGALQLRRMIEGIEKMHKETNLMIDLISLNNVGFSEKNKKFYLFDIDPLVCEHDKLNELGTKYEVDAEIGHDFTTAMDNQTTNAMEVNFEHLETLKLLLNKFKN